ncbi:hypothetical protein CLIB1423_29S00650 [[Candida] railenensis]|uniref:WW domain-containing protein n=1 Tax=[Candida] railenensis TaxID=45579 RepID=A0A9P0QTX6_9ASCO|nr:hypothetical protein CLIB1423_29S00650 [[Candida] railenensis]
MWTRAYDSDLQQYYFINDEDNSISYDSPCEVQYTPEIKSVKSGPFSSLKRKKSSSSATSSCCNFSKKSPSSASVSSSSSSSSVLSKITSVLSRKSSNSGNKSKNSISRSMSASSSSSQTLNNEEYSEEVFNQYNLPIETMKSLDFNTASFEDSNSIISGLDDEYLLENPINYRGNVGKNFFNGYQSDEESLSEESIHSYYYENSGEEYYEYEDESVYDFEKEKERLELRMQIRQELEA